MRTAVIVATVAMVLAPVGGASATGGLATAAEEFGAALGPADDVAAQIGELGRTEFRDSYAGLTVDSAANQLTVYATTEQRGAQLVAAGTSRLGPAITSQVHTTVKPAKHTRAQLVAAMEQVWQAADAWRASGPVVHAVAAAGDGSGLIVWTDNVERAHARPQQVAGVDLTYVVGPALSDTSRGNDSPPYWGGAVIKPQGGPCTSGFGMQAGGHTYLITAFHCVRTGEWVRDGGDDVIGKVTGTVPRLDAAAIMTSAGSHFYSSNGAYLHWVGSAWSYNGQSVCQSGYVSNYVCHLTVINDAYSWKGSNGVWRVGVLVRCSSGCVAARPGDSGAPVWTRYGTGDDAQIRGIVSAGTGDTMAFTEAANILNFWNDIQSPDPTTSGRRAPGAGRHPGAPPAQRVG